ncbi:MAG: cupredoxin domain-containing protein [Gemmatimonadetes bacterium]|jgi:plastocyanin|nr:cupredoxin domain-containing protein [Gemmatimonadota bacterium]MCC6771173.1 cupredoxin domain-containing protein [Gemmatimonadaceae bacterium]
MTRFLLAAALTASTLAAFSSAASAQDVKVTLSEWKMRTSVDTVKAGTVTFQITNVGAVDHSIQVVGPGVDKGSRQIGAKEVTTLTLTLKPGTYEIFCPLAEGSHKMAGMTRAFVVVPAASTP